MLSPLAEACMNFSTLQWAGMVVCAATALVQVAIFAVLGKRKQRSDFPIFCSYVVFSALANLLLIAVVLRSGPRSNQYFYAYWVLNVVVMVLEFGVMSEILTNALKPYTGLIDLGKMLFHWAALFLLLVAILTAFATSGSTITKCIAAGTIIGRSLRLMQCGLLLLFFLFERRLALSLRSAPVSLALGLGVTATAGISLSFLGAHFTSWIQVFDLTETALSFAIAIFWVACFARPELARKNVMDSPSKVIFQRWNEALLATASQEKNPALAAVDSFLPGIEKTVDRVLARKIAN